MKKITTLQNKSVFVSPFSIYHLSDEMAKKYGGKYAVTQGVFSEIFINEEGEDACLQTIKAYEYGGFFQTELEAFQHVKIVEQKMLIERIDSLWSNAKDLLKSVDIKSILDMQQQINLESKSMDLPSTKDLK